MDEWPPELAFIQGLEELMKCPICFDLMQAPVLLPNCEHNYCSLCVRRYFCQKEQCPTCGSPASSNLLRSNGLMEKTIEQFKKIRSPLRALCVNKLVQTQNLLQSGCEAVVETRSTGLSGTKKPRISCKTRSELSHAQEKTNGVGRRSTSRKRPVSQSESDSEDSDVQFVSEDESGMFNSSKMSSSSSQLQQLVLTPNQTDSMKPRNVQSKLLLSGSGRKTSAKENAKAKRELTAKSVNTGDSSPKVAFPLAVSGGQNSSCAVNVDSTPRVLSLSMMSQNRTDKKHGGVSSPEVEKVPCPVCGVPVVTSAVNRHLDLCLGREKQAAPKEKRKPLPKLVYNLMSDRDIRKRLKDLGLTCKGDRQALIKRHHEFTLYHNADCDSIAQKDMSLVKDFEDTQKMQTKLSFKAPGSNHAILRFTKDSEQEDIDKAQKNYEPLVMSRQRKLKVPAAERSRLWRERLALDPVKQRQVREADRERSRRYRQRPKSAEELEHIKQQQRVRQRRYDAKKREEKKAALAAGMCSAKKRAEEKAALAVETARTPLEKTRLDEENAARKREAVRLAVQKHRKKQTEEKKRRVREQRKEYYYRKKKEKAQL